MKVQVEKSKQFHPYTIAVESKEDHELLSNALILASGTSASDSFRSKVASLLKLISEAQE